MKNLVDLISLDLLKVFVWYFRLVDVFIVPTSKPGSLTGQSVGKFQTKWLSFSFALLNAALVNLLGLPFKRRGFHFHPGMAERQSPLPRKENSRIQVKFDQEV